MSEDGHSHDGHGHEGHSHDGHGHEGHSHAANHPHTNLLEHESQEQGIHTRSHRQSDTGGEVIKDVVGKSVMHQSALLQVTGAVLYADD